MESFQPELSFSPLNRAKTVSRLHGNNQPGLIQNSCSGPGRDFCRAETIKSGNGAILLYFAA